MGVFSPKATSPEVVGILEKTLLDIYADAASQAYLDSNNFSAFTANVKDLRSFQQSEIVRETQLVKQCNIPWL